MGRSSSSPDTRPRSRISTRWLLVTYQGDRLIYAARTRSGFTLASRAELFKKLKPLEIKECPFVNLPEKKAGRWGAGLTAAKIVECRWLKPQVVGQLEFVEWSPGFGYIGLCIHVKK
jgi:ATP-dependent DNA ligase